MTKVKKYQYRIRNLLMFGDYCLGTTTIGSSAVNLDLSFRTVGNIIKKEIRTYNNYLDQMKIEFGKQPFCHSVHNPRFYATARMTMLGDVIMLHINNNKDKYNAKQRKEIEDGLPYRTIKSEPIIS